VVSVLTPAEVLIAARRLAGARPHLAAVAGIVRPHLPMSGRCAPVYLCTFLYVINVDSDRQFGFVVPIGARRSLPDMSQATIRPGNMYGYAQSAAENVTDLQLGPPVDPLGIPARRRVTSGTTPQPGLDIGHGGPACWWLFGSEWCVLEW